MTIVYPQYELVVKTKEILNIKNFHITTFVCQVSQIRTMSRTNY